MPASASSPTSSDTSAYRSGLRSASNRAAASVPTSSARRAASSWRCRSTSTLYRHVLRWISKVIPSATRWACSTARLTAGSCTRPFGHTLRSAGTSSAACRVTRSSSTLTKNTEPPGSPCRPALPRSWSSTRRLSCRPLPITYSPPRSATRSRPASSRPPSRMSIPRPAICVDTVTAPARPASAMISASSASLRALSTTHSTPAARSRAASRSDSLTSSVPTSTGRSSSCAAATSSTRAASLCSRVA